MSASAPLVSIIVPCRNEARHIEACLQSILAQEALPGSFEVIVADGLSDDGTREKLARLAREEPRLRVVDNPGRIVSTGLNVAIKAARGETVVRMDAHTEYARDYVKQCVATLAATGADCVGGPWVARGAGRLSLAVAAAFQCPLVVGADRGHDPCYEGQVDTVYLGCWRKSLFDKAGLFDEELIRNQDDEFNLRVARSGGRIWQSPLIRSWYCPRSSLAALFRQYMQYGYWKVAVIKKHRLPASLRHLVPGGFVLTLALLALAAPFWPWAAWLCIAELACYLAFNIGASVMSCRKGGWGLLSTMPPVVAAYHFGYGLGFLRGLFDFMLRRKLKSGAFTALTRV